MLQRHVRERSLTRSQAGRLHRLFRADVDAGIWSLIEMSRPLLEEVERRVLALPPAAPLRAADAIHLTTAAEAGFGEIWTSDRHLLGAAPAFGLLGTSA